MKDVLVRAWVLWKRNFGAIVRFEIVYHLVISFLFFPGIYGIFRISTYFTGQGYIAGDDLRRYVTNPLVLLLGLAMAIMAVVATLVEMKALIFAFEASKQQRKITARRMLTCSLVHSVRSLKWNNIMVVPFILLLVPVTNVLISSGVIQVLSVPEFISDYIKANRMLDISLRLFVVLCVLFMIHLVLVVQVYTLENNSFSKACKRSKNLMKNHYIFSVVAICLYQVIWYIIAGIFLFVTTNASFLVIRLFVPTDSKHYFASVAAYMLGLLFVALAQTFSQPIGFSILHALYERYAKAANIVSAEDSVMPKMLEEDLPLEEVLELFPSRLSLPRRITFYVIIGMFLICFGMGAYSYVDKIAAGEITPVEIQAHRGSSVRSPENTMPAFQRAIDEGADWIELDVHQTSDGVVVVTHDESLKRIAGVKKNVWQVTYDELMQYDTGSWFSEEFSYVRVPTLDEVLKLCKGKIKVNIELKPTGHEPSFEENVIAIVKANDFDEDCVLASLSADSLKRVKELNPELTTLYITTVAAGDITKLSFADSFSIEESFLKESLVRKIHAAGKTVNAWTINKPENVIKMAELDVDGIITDDPVMAKDALLSGTLQNSLEGVVDEFFPVEEETDAYIEDPTVENP